MYNSDLPTRAELPSSAQLFKSTIIALFSALALLFCVVLPSEYAIDPTGIGRVLGLTSMGEIKLQLSKEAEADRPSTQPIVPDAQITPQTSSPEDNKVAEVQSAQPVSPVGVTPPPQAPRDEISLTLSPGQGTEIKLAMKESMIARFEWSANGSVLNHDTHGDSLIRSISYKKGRSVPFEKDELIAAFDGNHGWFWRNRTNEDVTLTLKVWGEYDKLLHLK